jgi:hypothetical protein
MRSLCSIEMLSTVYQPTQCLTSLLLIYAIRGIDCGVTSGANYPLPLVTARGFYLLAISARFGNDKGEGSVIGWARVKQVGCIIIRE